MKDVYKAHKPSKSEIVSPIAKRNQVIEQPKKSNQTSKKSK